MAAARQSTGRAATPRAISSRRIATTRRTACSSAIPSARDRPTARRSSCADSRAYVIIFAMITLTIGILTWGLVRLLDRRQQFVRELRRNEAKLEQQSSLLQSTLDHMGEGLSVFDRDNRLLAWNDRFISL